MNHSLNPFARVGRYVRQTVAELVKTVTPTGRQLVGWTLAVFLFVGLLMVFVSGMDMGFGWLTLRLFG
ncbi:preprotein translocase subunit SecE [Bifidobacterium felsineum]|uniref:preprotein translocase subunit SecE n=1 Tax=Bifidobacterium felsineum TaxID=2045440 RepID=UPI001C30A8EE|nr:preprotein translocase subunit SecE [Bifidobacterium felsineum]